MISSSTSASKMTMTSYGLMGRTSFGPPLVRWATTPAVPALRGRACGRRVWVLWHGLDSLGPGPIGAWTHWGLDPLDGAGDRARRGYTIFDDAPDTTTVRRPCDIYAAQLAPARREVARGELAAEGLDREREGLTGPVHGALVLRLGARDHVPERRAGAVGGVEADVEIDRHGRHGEAALDQGRELEDHRVVGPEVGAPAQALPALGFGVRDSRAEALPADRESGLGESLERRDRGLRGEQALDQRAGGRGSRGLGLGVAVVGDGASREHHHPGRHEREQRERDDPTGSHLRAPIGPVVAVRRRRSRTTRLPSPSSPSSPPRTRTARAPP